MHGKDSWVIDNTVNENVMHNAIYCDNLRIIVHYIIIINLIVSIRTVHDSVSYSCSHARSGSWLGETTLCTRCLHSSSLICSLLFLDVPKKRLLNK